MVKATEGTFKIGDQELYTKTWLPDNSSAIRAKLVFIHGFSDHVNAYLNFFDTLADRGIAVYGFDQRGWGRSVRKPADRGRTGPTTTVLNDIGAFVKSVRGNGVEAPLFVMGHSMGGNELAMLMSQPVGSPLETDVVQHVRGWLLEGPFFGWAPGETPSALKVWSGRLAGRFFPTMQLKHVIPNTYLSRDPDVIKRLDNDTLCHDTGTLEGLAGILDCTSEIAAGKRPPGPAVKSLWLGHGTEDLAASYSAAKQWYETCTASVPDKTLRSYEGWVHQLHGEPLADRELFYKETGDWILARTDGSKTESTSQAPAPEAAATPTATATAPAPAPVAPAIDVTPSAGGAEAKL